MVHAFFLVLVMFSITKILSAFVNYESCFSIVINFHGNSRIRSGQPILSSGDWAAECGGTGWLAAYTKLHADIRSGARPERLLIHVLPTTGLADRLTGSLTLFYISVLSGRAYLQTSVQGQLGLNAAFNYPFISLNTNLSTALSDGVTCGRYPCLSTTMSPLRPIKYDPITGQNGRYAIYFLTNRDDYCNGDMLRDDLSLVPPGSNGSAQVVVASSNRGRTYKLFDNPHHNNSLRKLGLFPETGVSCATRYLFSLKPTACNAFCRYASLALATAKSRGSLRVSIQIRTGDKAFLNDTGLSWNLIDPFFKCAQEASALRRKVGDPDPLFFLVSDSLRVRRQAKAMYGERLLVDTATPVEHISFNKEKNRTRAIQLATRAMQTAAAEMWLMAEADIHIVSYQSGFGMIAAWMSPLHRIGERTPRERTHIYRVGLDGRRYSCVATESAAMLASLWSGV